MVVDVNGNIWDANTLTEFEIDIEADRTVVVVYQ